MKPRIAIILLLLILTGAALPRPTQPHDNQELYSQSLYLHPGWNLVSWYVVPEDPTPWNDLFMDDLFNQDPPPGEDPWFDSDQEDITDMVGKYDARPYGEDPEVYPNVGYGSGGSAWRWFVHQSYNIYMESPAHFWNMQNCEDFTQGSFDFYPNDSWDRILAPPEFWFFLGYPLRMSQLIDEDENGISENPTIHGLENQPEPYYNHMQVLKSDEGKMYVPGHPEWSKLKYLEPCKGYFIGFQSDDNVECQGFTGEAEPEWLPPDPKSNDKITASVEPVHFLFKDRTQWWYPIVIDSVDLGQTSMETGDEIAVFDGDLCVGALVYEGEFPVVLAAWADDISTPNEIDGYIESNPMTFVWYDASENQEITFELPPKTQSALPEADPYRPNYSGFGTGFYAVRNLAYGLASVNQLPKEYRVYQNFPNPFNAETVIPLEIPQRSNIRIELFNIMGQKLGVIYQGVRNAGLVKIRHNASNLPSGIYLYCVKAEGLEKGGEFQDIGKMLLLR